MEIFFVAQNSQSDEDKLFPAFLKSDHGFAKENNIVGDWRVDGDSTLTVDPSSLAIGAGYFDASNNVEPLALLGNNTSANGFDFLTNTVDPSLEGDILISRFNPDGAGPQFDSGDIVHVDSLTGDPTVVVDGVIGILDIQRDPFGNFLFSDSSGNFGVLLVDVTAQETQGIVVGEPTEDGTAFDVAGQSFYNEAVLRVGGSTSTDIPEFIGLVFFDISNVELAPGETLTGGGALSFAVGTGGGGNYSGTLQVEYVGSLASIPTQDGGNDSPTDQELLAIAIQAADTEIFNSAVAVSESNTASISADILDTEDDILVFRFSDVAPATADNQQSDIESVSLTLETTGETGGTTGDLNNDGVVDCLDIDEYIDLLGTAVAGNAEFDLVTDGIIDSADVEFFVENHVVTSPNGVTGTALGDFNCDGQVDVLGDAFILVGNLNDAVDSYSLGDVNLDGTVDVLSDAFALVANLGFSNNQ